MVNPMPTQDQFKRRLHFSKISPPNVGKIRKTAKAKVNKIGRKK